MTRWWCAIGRGQLSSLPSSVRQALIDCGARSLRQDDGDDHAIETEGLSEDENEDHADEDLLLLGVGSNTGVTDDTNSETSCEGGETASQTGGEMLVSLGIRVVGGIDYNKDVLKIAAYLIRRTLWCPSYLVPFGKF